MFVLRTFNLDQSLVSKPVARRAKFVLRTFMFSKNDVRFSLLIAMGEVLELAARELSIAAKRKIDSRKPRARRGSTLRPSAETPLWNAVISQVKPHLKKRGDRAVLARELGVHRARIGEYFDTQTAMPDAERALQLLIWVARRQEQAKRVQGAD